MKLIVTDALNLKVITDSFTLKEILVRSVNAGHDLLVLPSDPVRAVEIIEKAVLKKEISEERINNSFDKICLYKKRKIIDLNLLNNRINTEKDFIFSIKTIIESIYKIGKLYYDAEKIDFENINILFLSGKKSYDNIFLDFKSRIGNKVNVINPDIEKKELKSLLNCVSGNFHSELLVICDIDSINIKSDVINFMNSISEIIENCYFLVTCSIELTKRLKNIKNILWTPDFIYPRLFLLPRLLKNIFISGRRLPDEIY